jgi:L-lactate dehydrogenase
MNTMHPKIAIVGCGNVGVRYAYALMLEEVAREIVMVDPAREKLEGDVMDLQQSVPFVRPVEIRMGEYPDIAGSDIVVITAGKRTKPDQSRLELIKDNIVLFRSIVPEVVRHAPQALLLIVSNPVDVLSYAAYRLSGLPAGRVIGSGTVLDTARLRSLMSQRCRIDARNLHVYIVGEHGDSEFAVWSQASIGGVRMDGYCPLCHQQESCDHEQGKERIVEQVRRAAPEIVKRKGETSYAIGLSLVRITKAILQDENAVLPVSTLLQNYYGLSDLYLSVPAVVNRDGVREVLPLELDDHEQAKLRTSAETVKKVINEAGLY